LSVEFGEGEWPRVGKQRVEVVDGVEDGYHVEEGGNTADNILGEDSFGDVDARVWEFFREVRYAVTGSLLARLTLLGCENAH
jgi:hypothetical protein